MPGGPSCGTRGCAAGVAMALFPKALRARFRRTGGREAAPGTYEIIGRTLGMDQATA